MLKCKTDDSSLALYAQKEKDGSTDSMSDHFHTGGKRPFDQSPAAEVGGAGFLYAAFQYRDCHIGIAACDLRTTTLDHKYPIFEHLHAGDDIVDNGLRVDSNGRGSEEITLERKWSLSSYSLSGHFNDFLCFLRKSCRTEDDMVSGFDHAALRIGDAVSEC